MARLPIHGIEYVGEHHMDTQTEGLKLNLRIELTAAQASALAKRSKLRTLTQNSAREIVTSLLQEKIEEVTKETAASGEAAARTN